MKRFQALLEKELTPAQEKAKQLGLKYRGFGYWQDPKTGKTAYKTEGDDLVPVDQEKQKELDDEEDEGITMGDPLSNGDPAAAATVAPTGSNVLGAPEPGKERPTHDSEDEATETGWDAGPDGDNMVNDQNKPTDKIPTDTYVGSNNNLSWVAGPDGSNFKNLSFDKIIDEALYYITEVNRSARTAGAKELNSGLNTHGAELMARNRRERGSTDVAATKWHKRGGVGTTDARKAAKRNRDIQQDVSDNNRGIRHNDHDEVMKDLLGLLTSNKPISDKGYTGAETQLYNLQNKEGSRTEREAAAGLEKMSSTEREKQLKSLDRLANQPSQPADKDGPGEPAINDRNRARNVQKRLRELPKIPQKKKDQELIKKMNEELKDLLADPSIDLDFSSLRGHGQGAFGTTYIGDELEHVIKTGKIGSKELKVLHKLKDSPYFPTLLNAMFETPFSNQSSELNNPYGRETLARKPGVENYPTRPIDWAGPTAQGTYAMGRAKGRPWARVRRELTHSEQEQRVANIWRAREALHKAGVSHNDMHGENIFMDDEGNPTILDLGLANDDPMSALQEALAGFYDEDYQMASGARFEDLPQDIQDKITKNVNNVERQLAERLNVMMDPSDDNYDWHLYDEFTRFLRGGIRLKDDQLKEIKEKFDLSEDEILNYISQIYDGLTPKQQTELEKRMSNAYDQRVADNEIMGAANRVRKNKGREPLTIPKNVVPSKNLDRTPLSQSSYDYDD